MSKTQENNSKIIEISHSIDNNDYNTDNNIEPFTWLSKNSDSLMSEDN